MTNLPAQIDEVDVVGVFFVIGNSSMQDTMRLLGVGRIDDTEACRDTADMCVNRHKGQSIGKHEGAGGSFGANARDAHEPLERLIGGHLDEMIDGVAPRGVIEVLEELLDVFGFVARQPSDTNRIDEFVKRRIAHVIPTQIALLQVGKCASAVAIGGTLRKNRLYEFIKSIAMLVPNPFSEMTIKSSEYGQNEVYLSHNVCNGMINVNQYHYSIESSPRTTRYKSTFEQMGHL